MRFVPQIGRHINGRSSIEVGRRVRSGCIRLSGSCVSLLLLLALRRWLLASMVRYLPAFFDDGQGLRITMTAGMMTTRSRSGSPGQRRKQKLLLSKYGHLRKKRRSIKNDNHNVPLWLGACGRKFQWANCHGSLWDPNFYDYVHFYMKSYEQLYVLNKRSACQRV